MQAGDIIAGRYRLGEPIGEGGIGVVWEAWQLGIERRVAIKFLKTAKASHHARFDVEARALGRLNHPNCVTVHDFGHTDDAAFLVMEYLDGRPLDDLRGMQLPPVDIVGVAKQVATALAYAHSQGVVHRDLKPENVFLVDSFDGGQLVKVLDFGLAKLLEPSPTPVTQTGEVFGTLVYMSPEQLRGARDVGPAADLYSLGVMLYELIDRRLPFNGDSALEVAMGHMMHDVPPLRRGAVPPRLEEIVLRLLAKEPEGRFRSAVEVYEALDSVVFVDVDSTLNLAAASGPVATLELPAAPPTADDSATLAYVTTDSPGLEREAFLTSSTSTSRVGLSVAVAAVLLLGSVGLWVAFSGDNEGAMEISSPMTDDTGSSVVVADNPLLLDDVDLGAETGDAGVPDAGEERDLGVPDQPAVATPVVRRKKRQKEVVAPSIVREAPVPTFSPPKLGE